MAHLKVRRGTVTRMRRLYGLTLMLKKESEVHQKYVTLIEQQFLSLQSNFDSLCVVRRLRDQGILPRGTEFFE